MPLFNTNQNYPPFEDLNPSVNNSSWDISLADIQNTPDGYILEDFYIVGSTPFNSYSFNLAIKDVRAQFPQYNTFKLLSTRQQIIPQGGDASYRATYTSVAYNANYTIDFNNAVIAEELQFNELNDWHNLGYNNVQCTIDYSLYADSPEGLVNLNSGIRVLFVIRLVDANTKYLDKSNLNFYYQVNGQSPTPQIFKVVTTEPTTLFVNKNFVLSGPDYSNVTELEVYDNTIKYEVSGVSTLSLAPSSSFLSLDVGSYLNNPNNFAGVPVLYAVKLSEGLADQNQIDASLEIFKDLYFYFNPTEINLTLINTSNQSISNTINFKVIGNSNYTLNAPNFLVVEGFTGQGGDTLIISVLPSLSYINGIYQNTLTITTDNAVYEIPVITQVVSPFVSNLKKRPLVNFTDENLVYSRSYYPDADSYYNSLDLTIPSFGFPTSNEEAKKFNFRYGFFNNEAKTHVGNILRRSLNRITAQDFYNLFSDSFLFLDYTPISFERRPQFRPANISLKHQILDYNNQPKESFTNSSLLFLKGRQPQYYNQVANLIFDNVTYRVTPNSIGVANFMHPKDHSVKYYLNNEEVMELYANIIYPQVYAAMIDFTKFIKVGDRFRVEIEVEPTDADLNENPSAEPVKMFKEFYCFPEGKYSHNLAFVTEYETIDFFEFTGAMSIQTEIERISINTFQNLVDYLENVSTDKKRTCTINTGYIPKDNYSIIEQIISFGMAFLIDRKTKTFIELVPLTDKLTSSDEQNQLYAYDVEFKINATHDFQVYQS